MCGRDTEARTEKHKLLIGEHNYGLLLMLNVKAR